jgi:hypothetical protein
LGQFNFVFSFTLGNETQTLGHNIARLCDTHVKSTACDSEAFNSRETLEKRKLHLLMDQNEYETDVDKPDHTLS